MRKQIFVVVSILVILCIITFSVSFYFSNKTNDIQNQERVSELVAEKYLVAFSKQPENDTTIQNPTNATTDETSDFEYDDNEIYSYFDESYARGYVDAVLEIPAIDFRQSIFSGTPDQIKHDLSRWLSVTARTDYVLGDTHYCIYMHNPRNKSIKISYAQEKLREKDYMVVTQKNIVYLYEVTGVFPEWRNKCTEMYVDNMDVASDKLYIFTCGRGEWQGRNVVIEGTVHSVYKTTDWASNKDKYIAEYKKSVGLIVEDSQETKERLRMSVESKSNAIVVSLYNPNYTSLAGCSIGIFDGDGYLVNEIENPIAYKGSPIELSQLPEGTYYIGVYNNDTDYDDPVPYKVIVGKQTYTQSIVAVDQDAVQDQQDVNIMKIVAMVMFSLAVIFGIVTIIMIVKNQKK